MNNSIKRAQSQARLSFAERENFRPKVRQYKKLMMTLALLLTVATGAMATTVKWVTEDFYNTGSAAFTKYDVTVTPSNNDARLSNYFYNNGVNTFTTTLGNFTKIEIVFKPESSPLNISGWTYEVIEAVQPDPQDMPEIVEYTSKVTWTGDAESVSIQGAIKNIQSITFTITDPNAVDVEPVEGKTNEWTFTQPGGDVVLTPIYAKTAAFATTGTEPEVTTLLPAAAEGVIAGTDAPLIVEGTVAFAGTSTEVKQGTVMYAVTPATATEAPALTSSDWKNTVPTAKDIADDGAEVKVWYYIQGADAPQGEAATLDNTFNNSEVSSLTVTVLSNKFDLALKAANANTIDATQASKGTVSVKVGTAAAVDKTEDITDGKLTAIKMGSEVKLNTKAGYKFRKVEVKKAASTPTLKDALADGATVVITYTWMGTNVTTFTYTNNGGNYTGSTTGADAEYFDNEMSMVGMNLKFRASNLDISDANVSIGFYTDTNEYVASKGSSFTSFTISVNGTDVTSQLTEVK